MTTVDAKPAYWWLDFDEVCKACGLSTTKDQTVRQPSQLGVSGLDPQSLRQKKDERSESSQ